MKQCGDCPKAQMKTGAVFILFMAMLLLAPLCLTACHGGGEPADATPIVSPEQVILPTPDPGGTAYAELSENFEITVYPARIVMDGDTKRLCYKVFFLNKTELEFNSFRASCVLSAEMQNYIASGIVVLGDVDIGPRTTRPLKPGQGPAVDASSNSAIADDDRLRALGLDPTRLAEFAKSVTLELTWDGGAPERVSFEVEVVDETA
jgi:hypothetical protein